ncbi:MAG: alpha/beta fold hydrolase [Phycisphaerales bacterium]|jgi:acylglycerol lipase|nr:alpha/beta fold hydrolase [Phycisphaerales bacterium]MBT7170270.1 alpha/beta fold hydrolase [Phycisphaerales bacterium]
MTSAPAPRPASVVTPPMGRQPRREMLDLRDGYTTSVYVHEPARHKIRQPRPVVFLHGIQSHPGWFYRSALAMADAGYRVYQVTRRGSGDNTTARGEAMSLEQLLLDIDDAICFAQRDSASERVHLVGISWGGKLAAAYLAWDGKKRANPPVSLALLSPGLAAKVDVKLRTKLSIAASLLFRKHTRLYELPLSEASLFTLNQPVLEYLRRDEFRLHHVTARFLYVSRRLDKLLAKAPRGVLSQPTLLVLAKRERIIHNAKVRKLVTKLTADAAEIVELDGYHTLEFEPDPHAVCEALLASLSRAEDVC